MRISDLKTGTIVYHKIYTHLGKGTVKMIAPRNGLEAVFERGQHRVIVSFEHDTGDWRCMPSALLKKPNRKRILEMIEVYARRGAVAQDGGDRLILPVENEPIVTGE